LLGADVVKFFLDNQLPVTLARHLQTRGLRLIAGFEQFWPIVESCLKAGDRIIEIR